MKLRLIISPLKLLQELLIIIITADLQRKTSLIYNRKSHKGILIQRNNIQHLLITNKNSCIVLQGYNIKITRILEAITFCRYSIPYMISLNLFIRLRKQRILKVKIKLLKT